MVEPEKHYTVMVSVHEVTPSWQEKTSSYSNGVPTKHDRKTTELLSVTARDGEEVSALEDAIAYLEVRLEKLRLVQDAEKKSEERGMEVRPRPVRDASQG